VVSASAAERDAQQEVASRTNVTQPEFMILLLSLLGDSALRAYAWVNRHGFTGFLHDVMTQLRELPGPAIVETRPAAG